MATKIHIRIGKMHPGSGTARPAPKKLDAQSPKASTSSKHNLAFRFAGSCRSSRAKIAVSNKQCRFSYHDIEQLAFNFAHALTSRSDFQSGDHVGLKLSNSAEYVVAFYGTLIAGGVVVPMPQYETTGKLEQLCELADVKFLASLGNGNDSDPDSSFEEEFEFASSSEDENSLGEIAAVDSHQLAMLMFTSGSTGDSKAVMLSHRNLIANCDSILQYLPIDDGDCALALMPFCHALGNSVLQTHILSGAQLVVEAESAYAPQILESISRFRCTSLSAVPEVFEGLLQADWSTNIKQHLKYIAVAGGALDADRARALQTNIKPAQLFVMYGQTEATARLAYLPPEHLIDAAESIGHAIDGVELRIRSVTDDPISPEMPGILYARGDNIMLGYWRDQNATDQVLQDGWLQTGDFAYLRDDGFVQLCGRSSELVKIQGYRFHPNEIEKRIVKQLPGVRAIATEFDFYGKQRIALFVVPDSGDSTSEQQIRSVCRQFLPIHMVPQRFKILEQWPINAAGKVDRMALKESLLSAKVASVSQKQNEHSNQFEENNCE